MITWKEDYSVKIAEIDRQHQKLVALINELETAMRAGKGKEALQKTLASLVSYTQTHFAYEEKLLAAHHYPDLKAHQAEHAALAQKAVALQKQYQEQQMGLTIPTANFLSDWLSSHILGHDKKYTPHLTASGVA
jgi:hemerythrin